MYFYCRWSLRLWKLSKLLRHRAVVSRVWIQPTNSSSLPTASCTAWTVPLSQYARMKVVWLRSERVTVFFLYFIRLWYYSSSCVILCHCVVVLLWSSWIMNCMLFTFKNRVPRLGASVVWHFSLPRMNSFNKAEAAIFPCRLCFLMVILVLFSV